MKRIFQTYLTIILLAISLFPNRTVAQSSTVQGVDEAFIDKLFSAYEKPYPGASCAVIKNGKVVFSKAYGYADVDKKVLATPKTNYRIASVSKQFTAMAIMKLIHRGKLSFETSLTDIFPEFPAYGKAINIRHLLTHRSGLVDYGRFLERGREKQLLNQEMFDFLLETESTLFTPGTEFRYSNTAYAILPLVVEKITGESYPAFMQREIFKPLKMKNTNTYKAGKAIPNRAYGHVVDGEDVMQRDQSLTSALLGDGSIYTSVLDYYKWDQALYGDKLLPQKELQEAFTAWDEKGKSSESGYGYGWFVNYVNGAKVLEHTGGTMGFVLHVVRIPSKNLSVAVFTNRNQGNRDFTSISYALLSIYSDGFYPMPEMYAKK